MTKHQAERYLERIGCGERRERGAEELERLVRAHLEHVPFENLDVCEDGRIPELTESAVYEKVVERERGGWCFELNTLFWGLLEELGYRVYPVAVRVIWGRDRLPAVSHMGLVAVVQDRKYYCDVGYGGPGPKGCMALETGEQTIGGERFLVENPADGEYRISRLHEGEWRGTLYFADRPVYREDFQLMNFYCARNPEVVFTRERVVYLCTPDGNKSLRGMELTVKTRGQENRTIYQNEEELRKGLFSEFRLAKDKR
ncbi:MAG: arylamine N-acetyltransferase [Eubacteriales bacterium]|nr:arylamine N-acetyltransferase [Eubacteriales bacterium]